MSALVLVLGLRLLYPDSALLDAIKAQESGGQWLARNGSHIGAYQVSKRATKVPWPLLYLEPIGRLEAARILYRFRRAAGGDVYRALEGYRHGYVGVRGETDGKYAHCVLTRTRMKVSVCKAVELVYDSRVLREEAQRMFP